MIGPFNGKLIGSNHLGKILMQLHTDLRTKQ